MKIYQRNCPECSDILTYSRKENLTYAINKNSLCFKCSHSNKENNTQTSRLCPTCGTKLTYSTLNNLKIAIRNNKPCRKCSRIAIHNYSNEERTSITRQCPKCLNSIIYKSATSCRDANKSNSLCRHCIATDRHKTSPIWGKREKRSYTFKDLWIKKLGKKEGTKKWINFRKNKIDKTSGELNPRFGIPAAKGSGNGWGGWYKGWYFRSIHELSYMIGVIEKEGHKWISAESKKYIIPYFDEYGKQKNYFADFIIDDKFMIEIKPKQLHKTTQVVLKAKAARERCKEWSLEYKLICPEIINKEIIKQLFLKGEIIFLQRLETKIRRYLKI